ncbi:MAG: hypothetical protein WA592_18355 [Pseudolabrys sp.]|jgi:hypothetical protein
MTKLDRDALKLAMEIASRDPGRAQQLKAKLKDEPWEKVSQFAAVCCQETVLQLKPWQTAPCTISDPDNPGAGRSEHEGRAEAARLLKRMLAAGVSRWYPDPLAALNE